MSVWEQSLDAYSGGYDPEKYRMRPYLFEAEDDFDDWGGEDDSDDDECGEG